MPRIIIDANVSLVWIFKEQPHLDRVHHLLSNNLLAAPTLWHLEVTNAILVRERRKIITRAQGDSYLKAIDSIQIDLHPDPPTRTSSTLAALARRHQLTSYDAVYLDLALSMRLPLLTLDKNLQAAASVCGLSVL